MNSRPSTRTQQGFTLIELILALALSAVLLAMLAAALSLGMSRAMVSRERVEQARLVEGVIGLIRSDVHHGVIYDPQDTSTAMQMAEAMAEFDVDSLDDIGSSDGGSSAGGSSSGVSSSSSEEDAESLSLRQPLGLYGTLQELQMDVYRERPNFELDSSGNVVPSASISGISTVRYALGEGGATLGVRGSMSGVEYGTGLIRQEANRDLLNWANQTGATTALVGTPQLVAPEVSRLEFRYFDGTQLYEYWDMQEMQGQLPRAVELRMWFAQQHEDRFGNVTTTESEPYVLVIALPSTWHYYSADLVGVDSGTTTSGTDSSGSSGSGGSR
ncbi:prepilin-type N-terminal cleavage/methylation domain-containing protein [Aeoliella sp.]|uniref:prepilin-type N-terminal cleavage/methylation domain-containing protein n=1 Tax=Aeoliella sp. TaxID=2795800 RepID=UPI003CCB8134